MDCFYFDFYFVVLDLGKEGQKENMRNGNWFISYSQNTKRIIQLQIELNAI